MGLFDALKVGQFKQEIEQLTKEKQDLERLLTPEMRDTLKLQKRIASLQVAQSEFSEQNKNIQLIINERNSQIQTLDRTISQKQKEIIELDDRILLQDFGIYTPIYDLVNSEAYKDRLTIIRQKQKDMIKQDAACSYSTTFTLNNSKTQGMKMVKDNVKQILRSFNNECDSAIDKVKFNNIESIRKKIEKSYNDLNKMNTAMSIRLNPSYLALKLEELNLCHEYALKKQEEKEEQKLIREKLREEAKLQKELDEARKTIEKEQKHYQNALKQLEKQLSSANEDELIELEAKKNEILSQLGDIEQSITDIDYRAANKRAGYVYIISNIGAFGPDVYKIGMTRRLEPMERVDELGDASVPFNFDVHALIFSDDAPALENALHKTFEANKLNMVNHRREFFRVTLEEIEACVKANYDKTVDFVKVAPAEQYRESIAMQNNAKS